MLLIVECQTAFIRLIRLLQLLLILRRIIQITFYERLLMQVLSYGC